MIKVFHKDETPIGEFTQEEIDEAVANGATISQKTVIEGEESNDDRPFYLMKGNLGDVQAQKKRVATHISQERMSELLKLGLINENDYFVLANDKAVAQSSDNEPIKITFDQIETEIGDDWLEIISTIKERLDLNAQISGVDNVIQVPEKIKESIENIFKEIGGTVAEEDDVRVLEAILKIKAKREDIISALVVYCRDLERDQHYTARFVPKFKTSK